MPSAERIRQLASQRQLARYGRVVDVGLLDAHTAPQEAPFASRQITSADLGETPLIRALRCRDELTLAFDGPPRTKKNHGRAFGLKQSVAYKRYRQDIITAIGPVARELQLPLPAIAYNCAAVYYVDRYGDAADYNGLNQGLHDALQDAGVLVDDWWIRTCDGTRIVCNDPTPRVELTLTPLAP